MQPSAKHLTAKKTPRSRVRMSNQVQLYLINSIRHIISDCSICSPNDIATLSHSTRALLEWAHAVINRESPCKESTSSSLTPPEYSVDQLYLDVELMAQSGRLALAEVLCLSEMAISGKFNRAIKILAKANQEALKLEKTVSLCEQLLIASPCDSEVTYQHGFALQELGRSDEAIQSIMHKLTLNPEPRFLRLAGFALHDLGLLQDAESILKQAIQSNPTDKFSIRRLSQIYCECGMYDESLKTIQSIPLEKRDLVDRLSEAQIYRFMGELEQSIDIHKELIKSDPTNPDLYWTQAFNYSISSESEIFDLLDCTKNFWKTKAASTSLEDDLESSCPIHCGPTIRIGFLTGDVGDHVVSRFLVPILRGHDRRLFQIELFSLVRHFDERSKQIAGYCDAAYSLDGMSRDNIIDCIRSRRLDVIIDTSGFTRNSGIEFLATRCAPIQCHYIGYHATTGLDTIDYFIGDDITVPVEIQYQFTERLAQVESPWLAYDSSIAFPMASSTVNHEAPVFGCYSQVSKVNSITLDYWSAALRACPDSYLVLKDRGCLSQRVRSRIIDYLNEKGVHSDRIYMFGPVDTHCDHLDSYNAIDISLDTTPWSSATTVFESLGMGVPMIAICGDTTSGRMSSSVLKSAGLSHMIASSPDEFADIAARFSSQYKNVRAEKAALQQSVRNGILFDEPRICNAFFSLISRLVNDSRPSAVQDYPN